MKLVATHAVENDIQGPARRHAILHVPDLRLVAGGDMVCMTTASSSLGEPDTARKR